VIERNRQTERERERGEREREREKKKDSDLYTFYLIKNNMTFFPRTFIFEIS
jgi:hypothetical protein